MLHFEIVRNRNTEVAKSLVLGWDDKSVNESSLGLRNDRAEATGSTSTSLPSVKPTSGLSIWEPFWISPLLLLLLRDAKLCARRERVCLSAGVRSSEGRWRASVIRCLCFFFFLPPALFTEWKRLSWHKSAQVCRLTAAPLTVHT